MKVITGLIGHSLRRSCNDSLNRYHCYRLASSLHPAGAGTLPHQRIEGYEGWIDYFAGRGSDTWIATCGLSTKCATTWCAACAGR